MQNTIYENHYAFLDDNKSTINSSVNFYNMLRDPALREGYFRALVEGIVCEDQSLLPIIQSNCMAICQKQCDAIIEESRSGNTPAIGYVSASFPILVDIYKEPQISEICNLYVSATPILTVPRIKIKARVSSYDGSQYKELFIPTATQSIKPEYVDITVPHGRTYNIFSGLNVSPSKMKLHRKYCFMKSIRVAEKNSSDVLVTTHNVNIGSIRADGRFQLEGNFSFTDSTGKTVNGTINGKIDFENNTILYNCETSGGLTGQTYTVLDAVFSHRFIPVNSMNGRVVLNVSATKEDFVIDVNSDFLIEVQEEDLQDYSSIYNINIVKTLGDAIKRQIKLDKDYELSFILKANESEMRKHGAYGKINLESFTTGVSGFTPASTEDLFKSILPTINSLYTKIRYNFGEYPKYIVTGKKTADLLRSLQSYSISMSGMNGMYGMNPSMGGTLNKMKVIEGHSIDDNKIYMTTKAADSSLERSSIVDFVFHPMWTIAEVTDGSKRTFVRSRTSIEVLRTDGLGYLEVDGLNRYFI